MNGISWWTICLVMVLDSLAIYTMAWLAHTAHQSFLKTSGRKCLTSADHRDKAAAWNWIALAGMIGFLASIVTGMMFETLMIIWPMLMCGVILIIGFGISEHHDRAARRMSSPIS